jgi:protein-glutamine gamma-glutamyltransferase
MPATSAPPVSDPTALRLGWMLAALGLALAPAIARLPPWISATFAIAVLWRVAVQYHGWRLPPGWLRLALAVACVLGVLFTFRTLNGLEAGGSLLVVMGAMKLLETRTRRDIQVLSFIGFFILLMQLLYDQPVWSLPWLALCVAAITVALLQGVRGGAPLPWRQATGLVLKMLAFAAPVALVLFLLFPRVPGPFWTLPSRAASGMTGLSEEMSPGKISQLIQSDALAFRVSFEGAIPPPAMRYWRGPVLDRFDGASWRSDERMPQLRPALEQRGPSYRYRITIEPHGRAWLLALDYPATWSDNTAFLTNEFQLVSRGPVDSVRALDIESWPLAAPEPASLDALTRMRALHLPADRNPRAVALARELRAAAATDEDFIGKVLGHFRLEPFVYTLRPPLLGGGQPVDEFLFRTRRGFCEHYASAFAVLARAAGIPARVVTGYQGGEINPISGRLVVRQSEAHAWAEVWLEGSGWTRVDPTAAVAPERIELSLADALPVDERVPGGTMRDFRGLRELSQSWDALNSVWTDWVLGYGPERQLALLTRLGMPGDWRALVAALTASVVIAMGSLTLWLAWRLRTPPAPEPLRLYREFCRRLERAGLARAAHEGPRDFAERIARERPALSARADRITRLYTRLRYGPAPTASMLAALRRELRAFRP